MTYHQIAFAMAIAALSFTVSLPVVAQVRHHTQPRQEQLTPAEQLNQDMAVHEHRKAMFDAQMKQEEEAFKRRKAALSQSQPLKQERERQNLEYKTKQEDLARKQQSEELKRRQDADKVVEPPKEQPPATKP